MHWEIVEQALESIAPLALAEPWDRVGLLLAPAEPRLVPLVALTIDLSEAALEEALAAGAGAVVAYHPPLFKGVDRLVGATAIERVVRRAVGAGIYVYSPHTALDAVRGGVNDWLAEAFGQAVRRAIRPAPAGRDPSQGAGRLLELLEPVSLSEAVAAIKRHLGLSQVRVATPARPRPIRQVALCAGAGGSVLSGCQADLYLTGEMRHHDVLAACGQGVTVVLTEHTNSERGYLPRLGQALQAHCGVELTPLPLQSDQEPLRWV